MVLCTFGGKVVAFASESDKVLTQNKLKICHQGVTPENSQSKWLQKRECEGKKVTFTTHYVAAEFSELKRDRQWNRNLKEV